MRWFGSLRVRVLLLVIAALLPALVVASVNALSERDRALDDIEDRGSLKLSTIVQTHEEHINETHRLLVTLEALLEATRNVPENCTETVTEFHSGFTRYTAFGRIDADGIAECLSIPFDARLDVSDRAYFQRARETGTFSVGDYNVGRVWAESDGPGQGATFGVELPAAAPPEDDRKPS